MLLCNAELLSSTFPLLALFGRMSGVAIFAHSVFKLVTLIAQCKMMHFTLHINIFIVLVGQGCQVPPDSHREQDPQAGPLLQDQESTGPQLEVVRVVFFFI